MKLTHTNFGKVERNEVEKGNSPAALRRELGIFKVLPVIAALAFPVVAAEAPTTAKLLFKGDSVGNVPNEG